MAPVQPNWAAGVAPSAVDSLLKAKFRPGAEIVLGVNILVIRTGKRCILIDSGCGAGFGSGTGWLPASLHEAGISRGEVTDVVNTHAHPDHIGGLLQADHTPAFPQADIHISNVEYSFWMEEAPDFSHSHLQHTELLQQIIASMTGSLRHIRRRTENGHLADWGTRRSKQGCRREWICERCSDELKGGLRRG